MSLEFLTNSLLTTVQDLGRDYYRNLGINPGGVMDKTAARLINILLGNQENEAVIEIHFPAPKILFHEDTVIALGGANFGAKLNATDIENWRPIFVQKKSVLSFPQKISGNRLYLSVKGGFRIEKWLESGSTNLKAGIGGFEGRALRKGDKICFRSSSESKSDSIRRLSNIKISKDIIPYYSPFPTIRVTIGAEFKKLTQSCKHLFQEQSFKIRRHSDRMGFRLKGESLKLEKQLELLSTPVGYGTIQILPDGQLIILMADHQTTGGYPRVAHIITKDLPIIAQLGADDKLSFKIVEVAEAETEMIEFEKDLNLLKTACHFMNL